MSTRRAARALRPLFAALVVASALALNGCSKGGATVSGKVTLAGDPLPSGTVLFFGSDGQPKTGAISEDGKYTITDLPPGEYKIAVQVQNIAASPIGGAGAAAGGRGGAAGGPAGGNEMGNGVPGQSEHVKPMPGTDRKVVQVPPQYQSPDTSGKTFSVKKGNKQTCNIELD